VASAGHGVSFNTLSTRGPKYKARRDKTRLPELPQPARYMVKDYLILKRASVSRPSGEWNDDDYDVLPMALSSAASSKPTPHR
jgi:hypothetical protein